MSDPITSLDQIEINKGAALRVVSGLLNLGSLSEDISTTTLKIAATSDNRHMADHVSRYFALTDGHASVVPVQKLPVEEMLVVSQSTTAIGILANNFLLMLSDIWGCDVESVIFRLASTYDEDLSWEIDEIATVALTVAGVALLTLSTLGVGAAPGLSASIMSYAALGTAVGNIVLTAHNYQKGDLSELSAAFAIGFSFFSVAFALNTTSATAFFNNLDEDALNTLSIIFASGRGDMVWGKILGDKYESWDEATFALVNNGLLSQDQLDALISQVSTQLNLPPEIVRQKLDTTYEAFSRVVSSTPVPTITLDPSLKLDHPDAVDPSGLTPEQVREERFRNWLNIHGRDYLARFSEDKEFTDAYFTEWEQQHPNADPYNINLPTIPTDIGDNDLWSRTGASYDFDGDGSYDIVDTDVDDDGIKNVDDKNPYNPSVK